MANSSNRNSNHNHNISSISIDESQAAIDELPEYPASDTFRILIVTDTHLGHLERDEIRRYDSFRAFDEALSIGKHHNVDFVLHAGDLFDKNQPSRFCMVKTLHILKKHTLGNKPIHFQIVSDQTQNFPSTGRVNYEDPNYNISLPIFIQHGNHDDPAGLGNHAALEQLSATNLVNYIGRSDDLENIHIFPILMQKGGTKLAIYPLGYIRDERLHRAFLHHKVKWVKPKKNTGDWFNIAMIHQNRTRHSQQYKDCIPEEFLPNFLDIVYWGHEHESLVDLAESSTSNFFITQPGSTVITSLNQSESRSKYVGIMEIRRDECKLIPFKLKTTRPFIFDEVVLSDHFEEDAEAEDICEFLVDKVTNMIEQANNEHPPPSQLSDRHLSFVTNYTETHSSNADNAEETKPNISRLPLIRLRVDHSKFAKIRSAQFGQNFLGKVANPDDILLFHRRSLNKKKENGDDKEKERQMRGGNLFNLNLSEEQTQSIQDIVTENITNDSSDPLSIFPELDLLKSIQDFVDKEDNHCIEEYCDQRLEQLAEKLIEIKCVGVEKEIKNQSMENTNYRRKQLRQQRAMQILNDEEKKSEQIKVEQNEDKEDEKMKEEAVIMSESDDEIMKLPKKRKGNLRSFGRGNASQKYVERIVNSQNSQSKSEEIVIDDDDDLDLSGIQITNKNGIGPKRKRRKLNLSEDEDGDGANDVIDSLLGFDEDDFDMNGNGNHNKNNKNMNDSLTESVGISQVSTKSIVKSQNQIIEDTQTQTQSTQNNRRRSRRQRRSVNQKNNSWGSLLSKRSK